MSYLSKVSFGLAEQLKDRAFRSRFFRTLAQDSIASQLRYLRELRGMRQADLAKAADTQQSVISRLEKSDYAGWGFNTLMKLGDALDARVTVSIEPAEEAVAKFEDDAEAQNGSAAWVVETQRTVPDRATSNVVIRQLSYAS